MKTTILKAIVLFLLITTIYSCGKDDGNPIQDNGNLKVKIDGIDYSNGAVSSFFDQETHITSIDDDTDPNGRRFRFILNNPITVGTFITSSGEKFPQLGYDQVGPVAGQWLADEHIGSGTITITKINGTAIEGTFSFTGVNISDNSEKIFTDGSFKTLKY